MGGLTNSNKTTMYFRTLGTGLEFLKMSKEELKKNLTDGQLEVIWELSRKFREQGEKKKKKKLKVKKEEKT